MRPLQRRTHNIAAHLQASMLLDLHQLNSSRNTGIPTSSYETRHLSELYRISTQSQLESLRNQLICFES